ncbi:hypothetical protein OnM2_011024 [Erysiphe neolycopersici]|uniref:Uncharacterized protein n=1 Tax=Erysiphe neolycopersici TaxID=212602 RepID=A0A420I6C4_9PEZI|nr:hypothetical protein OnM2_011024 [Erysiphe neolycopersici]
MSWTTQRKVQTNFKSCGPNSRYSGVFTQTRDRYDNLKETQIYANTKLYSRFEGLPGETSDAALRARAPMTLSSCKQAHQAKKKLPPMYRKR